MIKKDTVILAMYEAVRRAATILPRDVRLFLDRALSEEKEPLARKHLEVTFKNIELAESGGGLLCGDTGFPLFYLKAGSGIDIEGGPGVFRECAEKAVEKATLENFLRPTMVDPLSRQNPGSNAGSGMPVVELSFEGSGKGLEITAVPKGGGSEIFGTFYRMIYPSEGKEGIFRFVAESIYEGCYAGKICPPAIIGVGIGGTAELCMRMAKEAAVLRPLGSINPDSRLADIELNLLKCLRGIGLGPMGARGLNAVMGLHIALAATHTAALPAAVNAQCCIARRWKASITDCNEISYTGDFSA